MKEFCKAFVEVPGSRRTSPLLVALIQLHYDERGEIQKREEGETMREEERQENFVFESYAIWLGGSSTAHEKEKLMHTQDIRRTRGESTFAAVNKRS
jgi:hypothetical protein